MQVQNRILSAYEYAELIKHGFDPATIVIEDDIPIEYVTGFVQFAGREFGVTPATLIPRVETEELLKLILKHVHHFPPTQTLTIIEIGTGSGALGISLLLELQGIARPTHAYLSDISAEALEVTRQNVRRHLAQTPVSIVESDLLNAYPSGQQFDLIIANLPYIPSDLLSGLDPSVRDYEPWLALDGGELGLELIHRLLTQAQTRLSANGDIWLEIDDSHTESLLDPTGIYQVSIMRDSYNRRRFARLRLKT